MRPLVLVLLALCACSAPSPPGPQFHEDVEPILMASCQGCHAAGGIGPFPLGTFAQAKERAGAISVAVQSGKMPPWMAGEGCGPPVRDQLHMQQAQIDTAGKWARRSPEGDTAK